MQVFALIRQWEASGISQEKFFKQHSIAKSTFGYWRRKYIAEMGRSRERKDFIPVIISDAIQHNQGQSTSPIELIYPNGIRLICSSAMDLSLLKPLIIL